MLVLGACWWVSWEEGWHMQCSWRALASTKDCWEDPGLLLLPLPLLPVLANANACLPSTQDGARGGGAAAARRVAAGGARHAQPGAYPASAGHGHAARRARHLDFGRGGWPCVVQGLLFGGGVSGWQPGFWDVLGGRNRKCLRPEHLHAPRTRNDTHHAHIHIRNCRRPT